MRFRSINNDSTYFISKTTGFVQSAFLWHHEFILSSIEANCKYHAVKIDP